MQSKEEIVKCLNDIIDKYYEKISTIGEDDYNEDLDDICCDINELIEKIEDGIATDDYYRGYNERDKLAKEICKKCKYRKKVREVESKEQKLIDKLEEDIANITKTMQDGKHCDDYSRCRLKAYRTKTKEILEILKGESDE